MKSSYNKKYGIDEVRLLRFIKETQLEKYEKLKLDTETGKTNFFRRLSDIIRKDGVVSVLKNGIKCYPVENAILFYHALDKKRPASFDEFNSNIFAVTNQFTYSESNPALELDLCIFINGLPIITMELKSRASSTGWTYKDAEEQYKNERSNKDKLFEFKKCIAHFAVDENMISFTTKIDGKDTKFMPFNKGVNGGAGNPVNDGTMTDYLWKYFLDKETLTSLIVDFCNVVKDKESKKETLIFPRFHQHRVVTRLLADVLEKGVGQKYLIQHSAGSGKSNSITWLAYRLVTAERNDKKVFDSVIVVTDRKVLDSQISKNIRNFLDVSSIVGRAGSSKELKEMLSDGKKIITTTVQKFPYILKDIGTTLKDNNFAVIIDEAHSSQSGKAAASLNMSISGKVDFNEDFEVEDLLSALIEAKTMPKNASFFAFTATPKARTIEMFGSAFDVYSMKQAIEEGFILDVLKNYTQYQNYYKIYKTIEDNPEFDSKKAKRKIRSYVEGQEFPIRQKAEEIVNHFINNTKNKINGKAKAMVVTSSILRAIDYYYAINDILKNTKTGYKAIVAFSGEKEYKGKKLTESSINGFSDKETPIEFKKDEYKFLIVADKYQTGYDEPLLHTMYVDKVLNSVKAVQTLSRLNRSAKNKIDTCVIDFANDPEDIEKSFQPYYKETKLEKTTDPNKIYNILSDLDSKYVYEEDEVNRYVELFLDDSERYLSDPILDKCVERYKELDEEDQVEFKSGVKSFLRTYNFLASILPIGQVEWERKSIFFQGLIYRLPTPKGNDDLTAGILESIDLESYRLEKRNAVDIILENEDGQVANIDTGIGRKSEPEMDLLEKIVANFNDIFGNIEWQDKDNVERQIRELPNMVMKNERLKNALKNSDVENVKKEYGVALDKALRSIIKDNMDLFVQYTNNDNFSSWLKKSIFEEILERSKNMQEENK
ncbi:type i site-specific deoxyribonuclease [Ligilactobacillus ceti DSM 22408]|uniref:Type i site-specific deoxyribonuclease n=2 Tax=Ligilactobacillus TaxID=2767887 RepID=A0A0R2KH75_9LACO|nr:type i site-specific deoxyribonuclease [Ligilactobacillus ceti DSM 22408]